MSLHKKICQRTTLFQCKHEHDTEVTATSTKQCENYSHGRHLHVKRHLHTNKQEHCYTVVLLCYTDDTAL